MPVVSVLQPRAQDDRIGRVEHLPEERGRRVGGVVAERKLRDQEAEEVRERRLVALGRDEGEDLVQAQPNHRRRGLEVLAVRLHDALDTGRRQQNSCLLF